MNETQKVWPVNRLLTKDFLSQVKNVVATSSYQTFQDASKRASIIEQKKVPAVSDEMFKNIFLAIVNQIDLVDLTPEAKTTVLINLLSIAHAESGFNPQALNVQYKVNDDLGEKFTLTSFEKKITLPGYAAMGLFQMMYATIFPYLPYELHGRDVCLQNFYPNTTFLAIPWAVNTAVQHYNMYRSVNKLTGNCNADSLFAQYLTHWRGPSFSSQFMRMVPSERMAYMKRKMPQVSVTHFRAQFDKLFATMFKLRDVFNRGGVRWLI